jgi:hypothetical protein
MLKVLLLSVVLLFLAFAGLAIKMFFDRKAEFKGGSCSATSPELESRGISCGCGGSCSTVD